MTAHRRVRRSAGFVERAHRLFPPGGTPEGTPSFELFENLIVRAVEEAFARDFEGQSSEVPGLPIRFIATAAAPVFDTPLVFYALLVDADTVELVDVEIDTDYFTLGDDSDL